MRRSALPTTVLALTLAATLGPASPALARREDRIIMGLSPKTIKPGGTVTVQGGVTTYIGEGTKVTLQKKFATGGWINAGTFALYGDGRFRFAEKPTTTKSRKYRVCFNKVCSDPVKLTIS